MRSASYGAILRTQLSDRGAKSDLPVPLGTLVPTRASAPDPMRPPVAARTRLSQRNAATPVAQGLQGWGVVGLNH